MPDKSVRDMSVFERMHYSLSSRMFHTILVFSLLLILAAGLISSWLFSRAVRAQLEENTWNLSQNISILLDGDTVERYTDKAEEIYRSLDPELRNNPDSEEYRAAFAQLQDEQWTQISGMLERLVQANSAGRITIGKNLPDENRFLSVFDAREGENARPAGIWEVPVSSERELNPVTSYAPVIFDRADKELQCIGKAVLSDGAGRECADIIVGYSLNAAARRVRHVMVQLLLVLLLITAAADYFIVQKMKKTVVKPLNDLSRAAEEYIEDKKDGVMVEHHFQDLTIKTGDEIENLSLLMAEMERDIDEYVRNLTGITREKERISTELGIASQIQEGMIPSIFPPFPDRTEFDLYAYLNTAKEVGGDFYDYYLLDEDHLAVVMADVSGKGVPGALFMMASKILINNYAVVLEHDPAAILAALNRTICANNKAEMFVTIWLGILNIPTGVMKAANAGHEYPIIGGRETPFALFRDKHGFVIGGMEDSAYTNYEIQMKPGDQIFLYTDGITDAMNSSGEMFGINRVVASLNAARPCSPKEALEHVASDIRSYVGGEDQFDDITMLMLEYLGADEKSAEITVDAVLSSIHRVTDFVEEKLEKAGCPHKVQMQISIALDEILSNIAKYAYPDKQGKMTVRLRAEASFAEVTFADSGIPYNPLEAATPDTTKPAMERIAGGLGIFVVKKTMDSMTYEYRNGQNILTIRKNY